MRLRCGRMVHGGLCLARGDDGVAVLVAGAIPGELIDAELRYRKGATWFAETVAAVEASPHRTEPPCPYVPQCGGCQLQHVAYPEQLELKRAMVTDALRRQGVTAPEPVRVVGMSDPWRYRRRGEFHVVAGDGAHAAGLGFNRARSWRPIAIDDCLIHDALITRALPVLRDMVREGGSARLGTLHLTAGEDGRELLLRAKPANALDAAAVDAASLRMPGGARLTTDSTSLRWREHTYRVTPDAFVQVNVAQMGSLYDAVIAGLDGHVGRRVIDAYAGIGVLAVDLAATGAQVVCIESNRAAARLGVLNAQLNDVADRMRYVVAPVETALAAAAAPSDLVILDPPRAGCAGNVTGWLALAGPRRVVYMSCDPATLARDLHVLVASGPYDVNDVVVVDMFPHTHHVETVVTLTRADG